MHLSVKPPLWFLPIFLQDQIPSNVPNIEVFLTPLGWWRPRLHRESILNHFLVASESILSRLQASNWLKIDSETTETRLETEEQNPSPPIPCVCEGLPMRPMDILSSGDALVIKMITCIEVSLAIYRGQKGLSLGKSKKSLNLPGKVQKKSEKGSRRLSAPGSKEVRKRVENDSTENLSH